MKYRSVVFSAALVWGLASPVVISSALGAIAPPLSLAQVYHDDIDLSYYWVSEKLDGARVWWNGRQLLSRNGNIYHAPHWFTENLPDHVLDGELWIGRGLFQLLMQAIRDTVPDDTAWRQVQFYVFDAPRIDGDFTERQRQLSAIVTKSSIPWLKLVPQKRIADPVNLQDWLSHVVTGGGEGLMLQRGDLPYRSGRHDGMMKLKTHQDAEARVVGYTAGKGKYKGMTGSLVVVDDSGLSFRLGSGLSDAERRSPPAVGAVVSYRYQGRTLSGKPRFARFLRERPEE